MPSSNHDSVQPLISGPGLPPIDLIFGTTPAMEAVRQKLISAARTNIPVLIRGVSGSGKEIIARLVHLNSPWSEGPFVKVNCPAIPDTLIESELFGYERGAFTGANTRKLGRFDAANRGTLFLDEIGDLPIGLQAKLLQVLQNGKFARLGGETDHSVEVRIVSATNHFIEEDIGNGTFRGDLFYRLDGITIHLPSLAERRADIPQLANYFVDHYNAVMGRRTPYFSAAAIQKLVNGKWHGNIRELENVVRRYVVFGGQESLLEELAARDALTYTPEIALDGDLSLKQITRHAVRELEHKIISHVLLAHHGNRTNAARALKISYRALMYKIREAGFPRVRNIAPRTGIGEPQREIHVKTSDTMPPE